MQLISIASFTLLFITANAQRVHGKNKLLEDFLREEAEYTCSLPVATSKRIRGDDDEFDFIDSKSENCRLRAIELRDITTEVFGEFEFHRNIECDRDAGRGRRNGAERYVKACEAFSALKSMCVMETAPIEGGDSCVNSLLQSSYYDKVDADLEALRKLDFSDTLKHLDTLSNCAIFAINSLAESDVRHWHLKHRSRNVDEDKLVLDVASFPAGSRWIHAVAQLEQLESDGHVITGMRPRSWHEGDLPSITVYYI